MDDEAQHRLSVLGDLLLDAALNVTGVRYPAEIERVHFLDSLSLLGLSAIDTAARLADIGSGGGLPALVLAIARPGIAVTAIESHRKKCDYLQTVATILELHNLRVRCCRVEEYARAEGREAHDAAVSRAVAALSVVAEYSLPLLHVGGTMVAMTGLISDQERTRAKRALGILGADRLESVRMDPFEGSRDRWVHLAEKVRVTPDTYPRRPGIPAKRPLGGPERPQQ